MTKEIAVFSSSALRSVILRVREAGYQFRNPTTAKITGFDSAGDRCELATEDDAIGFLRDGNGLQLWANESEDVFVSTESGGTRVYFDGFTFDESQQLMQVFQAAGLSFTLDYDY